MNGNLISYITKHMNYPIKHYYFPGAEETDIHARMDIQLQQK